MYTDDEERRGLPIKTFIISLILIIILVLLLVWLLPMPNMKGINNRIFNANIQEMKNAAIPYFTTDKLPQEVGDEVTLTLQEMIDLNLLLPFTDKNGDACDTQKSYVTLTKKDNEYEMKIASTTKTNAALRKKNTVQGLIEEIRVQATKALKKEIIKKTNEKVRRVITDDYIEIENIDGYIKLKNRDGASEGQTLSIGYCFLGTLFEDSELEFPFIIDSPTGKMDFDKRQAVADIIPLVFNQMIAFVQSAEVERFADRFYGNADSQYLTIVASKETGEVTVHEGIEYFDSYQHEHKGDEV